MMLLLESLAPGEDFDMVLWKCVQCGELSARLFGI
jgi:hypothetical protein